MKVMEAVLRAIRDTLSWDVVKVSLMVSVPLALLWFGIAYVLWQPVSGITAMVIGWIPFSILKANGAFLIGGFVWFQVVLITYAMFVAVFNNLIFRYVPDQKFESFSIVLLLLVSLGWTLFAFLNWDMVFSEVSKVLTWFPFQTLQEGVALMLAALFFYNLFIVSLALVVLMVRKPFLHKLLERDYPEVRLTDDVKKRKFFSVALRDVVIFFVLMTLFFPLFFVPFINMGIQILLWAWLIRESYFLSVASLYGSEEEIKELKKHNFVIWGIAFTASMLNLIPVVNILSPFFALIIFFHWIMLNRPLLPVPVKEEAQK